VISRDLRIEDIDARHWVNLVRLVQPDAAAYRAGGLARLPLVVILEDGRPVKAVRVGVGRVPLAEVRWHGPAAVDRARTENGCALLLAAELGALREVLADLETRVRLSEDGVAQSLRIATAIRARMGQGIYLSPRLLKGVPVPSYEAVQRTFDLLYPDDRAAAFYLFHRGEIHTSGITTKRRGDLTLLTSHLALGVPVTDWHRDYPRLLESIERRFARPFLGIFAELGAVQRVLAGTSSVAREVAGREIVLDPAPPWLRALVAADAGAQVAQAGAGLLRRFVPSSIMSIARGAYERAAEGPFTLLGFNPFQVAGELLRLSRRPPPP
jgi:hypothetical protein